MAISCKRGFSVSRLDSDASDSDAIDSSSSSSSGALWICDTVRAGSLMEVGSTRLRYILEVSMWIPFVRLLLTQLTMFSMSCFRLPALRRLLSTQMCHSTCFRHLSGPISKSRRTRASGLSRMMANHRDNTRSLGRGTSFIGRIVDPSPPLTDTGSRGGITQRVN